MNIIEAYEALPRREQLVLALEALKSTPIGFFSDTDRGREALGIHADSLKEVTDELNQEQPA